MDKELSELRRRARTLRPMLHVGRAGVTESLIRQVRQAFAHNNLIKIRIAAADRQAVAAAAESLVQRVPCRLVERKGFVATLRAPELAAALPSSDAPDGCATVEIPAPSEVE